MTVQSNSFRTHFIAVFTILLLVFTLFVVLDDAQFELRDDGTIVSEEAKFIQTDSIGNIIVAGYTQSDTFQATLGSGRSGKSDLFVIKFDSSYNIIWSQLIGGSDHDYISGLVLDSLDNIVIAGSTASIDFEDQEYKLNGSADLFVMKIFANGEIDYVNLFGSVGSYFDPSLNLEGIQSLAITSTDEVLIGGYTFSSTVIEPTREVSYDRPHPLDLFLAKFNTQSDLLWVNYQPATWNDKLSKIMVLHDSILTVTCLDFEFYTYIQNGFPASYLYDLEKSLEIKDIMISRYNANGNITQSVLFGGAGYDCATDILHTDSEIILSGVTRSDDFVSNQATKGGYGDIFVMSLTNDLIPIWSTLIGGNEIDGGNRDQSGVFLTTLHDRIIVGTSTYSSDFPGTYSGEWDLLLIQLSLDGVPLQYIYYGGSSIEYLEGIIMTSQYISLIGYPLFRFLY